MRWSQDDLVLASPALVLSGTITTNFGAGSLFRSSLYFQRGECRHVLLISPKIIGAVAVSDANTTSLPWAFMAGVGRQGLEKCEGGGEKKLKL